MKLPLEHNSPSASDDATQNAPAQVLSSQQLQDNPISDAEAETFNPLDLDKDLRTLKIVDDDGECVGWFVREAKLGNRTFKGAFIKANGTGKVPCVMKVFTPAEEDHLYYDGMVTRFECQEDMSIVMRESSYTPTLIASGHSKGGYSTPGGDVVLHALCPGKVMSDGFGNSLSIDSDHPLVNALRKAFQEIHDKGSIISGLQRRDILWDDETQQLSIINLEDCYEFEGPPEIYANFEIQDLIIS
ncbi:hypothetical protein TWF696_007614 [Orbilia brochopaga]|uniref:Uncharacterized protein n=1 Tax=Orbilia brochopaga TaxID=3140254 RepID=A0AAV9UKV8_9PEZI